MVTALCLYEGEYLSELRLAGITTNPMVIAKVMDLLNVEEPNLLPPVKPVTRHRGKLRVIKDAYDDKRA